MFCNLDVALLLLFAWVVVVVVEEEDDDELFNGSTAPTLTGFPKCSGFVKGNWSNVSDSAKCLPLFKHNAFRLKIH